MHARGVCGMIWHGDDETDLEHRRNACRIVLGAICDIFGGCDDDY
jgi:hypothetical protein